MITALRVSTDDLLTEMGSSSKSQHRRDKDKSNKRERRESKKRSSKVVDQDEQEEWVEKPTAPAPAPIAVQSVPTSESYKVHANPSAPVREDWLGLGHNTTVSNSTTSNSFDPRAKGRLATEEDITDGFGQGENGSQSDFFRSFGTQGSAREEREKRREADKLAQPAVSAREINKTAFLAAQDQRPLKKPKVEFGGAGSSWRMTKLRRVYEAAEDEGRDVQQVALERYGSASAWEEALAERAFLDGASQSATQNATQVDQFGREVRPDPSAHAPQPPTNATATRLLFNQSADSDVSRPSSRQSFRRPGESPASNQPSRFNSPKPSTPIPSVTTPSIVQQRPSALSRGDSIVDEPSASTAKPVSPTTLNRLQAKVLKAKLIDPDSEETLELQKQYDLALAAHQSGASSNQQTEQVRVLPSLDGRGRLYDIGAAGSSAEAAERAQLSKRQKRKRDEQFESRDAQGNLVRYNADDDQQSLADLVRAEKFGGGSAEDKDLNKQLAGRIARDATFQNDLEYMDDMAEKLGRKKARDEDRKRMWAIQGEWSLDERKAVNAHEPLQTMLEQKKH